MPYIPHLNTILLQIPKSGSSSLVKAASMLGPMTHIGHLRASAYGIPASRIIAVVRDPVSRLVSALNYYYTPQPVDDMLRHVLKYRIGQVAFKPQEWFMDIPCDVYPIERMSDALASIGYFGDVPKENVSIKWVCREELECSKYWALLLNWRGCGIYYTIPANP